MPLTLVIARTSSISEYFRTYAADVYNWKCVRISGNQKSNRELLKTTQSNGTNRRKIPEIERLYASRLLTLEVRLLHAWNTFVHLLRAVRHLGGYPIPSHETWSLQPQLSTCSFAHLLPLFWSL